MRQLNLSSWACDDMDKIYKYVSRTSRIAADKVMQAFDEKMLELLFMPGIGHTRKDVPDESYVFSRVYSYLIVYRFDDASVTVLRVVHAARNLPKIFE